MTFQTSRRAFLKGAAAGSAALVVGFTPTGLLAATSGPADFNPFVKISADGTVTVIIKHFEMGQGTTTGLATLAAEELDADWSGVAIEFAPADNARYANLLFHAQGTGGSTAIANSYMQYRKAGAAARDMLVRAAADAWGVDPKTVSVENSTLKAGDKSASFGEFAAAAAKLEAPAEPALKSSADFKLIGNTDLPRKDNDAKTNGTAIFAMDVKIPGMVYAVVLRSPKFGGTLKSFDASGAKEVKGFRDAKMLPNNAAVAIYADSTWAAISAREAVTAEWDFSNAETRSSDALMEGHLALLDSPQYQARKGGDFTATASAIDGAAKVVEGEFRFPNLAHAAMEVLNCVIEPTETGVRIHDGSQFPALTQPTVATILNLDPSKVEINTVYAGGSFGRRATPTSDYQAEAALVFAALGGKTPVKVMWTREDDFRGGYYRPMAAHRVRIGLSDDGKIAGWDHRISTKSILKGTLFESMLVHDGIDHSSVEGVSDTDYAIPVMSVGLSDFTTEIPVLWWRSVGHTHTAYAMEVMMDMAAEAAGKDPVDFRLDLLSGGSKDQQRLAGVLKMAAERADWKSPLPEGRGRGVAVHKSFSSYVAQVVEVSVDNGDIRIEKVTCAVDCGVAVNPDVIRAQMEGGIGYGIGHVMRNQITMTDGEIDQANFPDYEPLRISDIGEIEVFIVQSEEAPTGVGEPGVPPAGPALANAIHKATGTRATTLPMEENGILFV